MDQHTVKKNASPPTSAEVIQLLKQDSIENAINWMDFRRLPVLERSVTMSSITGFLPLYLYRCGLYDRCLKLCQENILAANNGDACRMLRLSSTYRVFIQLMDSDVVSLLGLTLLVDRTAGAQTNFTGPMTVSQLSLTFSLSRRVNFAVIVTMGFRSFWIGLQMRRRLFLAITFWII